MSDFNVSFVEGIIPGSDADVDVGSPPMVGVVDFAKTFLVPASYPHITGGNGRATGGAQDDTFANVMTEAFLVDFDTLRFTDSTAVSSFNNLVGCHVVQYLGAAGGPNEVIVRAVKQFSSTAQTFDSTAIAGIGNLAKCVPFAFVRGTLNNQTISEATARVEVVNDGVNDVVRVTKQAVGGNTMFVTVYVVEFVGANWTVQKVDHTFTAAAVNENVAISSVGNVANAFVYSTPMLTNSRPDRATFYAWLSSATQLRHWLAATTGTNPRVISYVVSHPNLNVAVYGADPDGTADLAAVGAAPETRDITISAVPDFAEQTMVLGYAGSLHNTAINVPSIVTMMNLTSATNLRLRRSISNGGTEYKIQVIDFSAIIGNTVDSVDPIIDGANFNINGVFGAVTAVTLGGVAQPAVSGNASLIVRTGALGTLKYGVPLDLVVTAGTVMTVPNQSISPPATKNFVDLSTLTTSGQRITATPDLAPGDQLEWSNVVGGTIADVTVFDDGSFSSAPAVTAFDVRVNDGTGWGTIATQDVANQATDTVNVIRRMTTDLTRLITFALTNLEYDS